jgi:hypothetical protein
MRRLALWGLGLIQLATGLMLLVDPLTFYNTVPGVAETGPFNHHFLNDVGAALLVAGGGLAAFALNVQARSAAIAGAAFLSLHALVHLADGLAGREAMAHLTLDLPLLGGFALLALWLTLMPVPAHASWRSPMIKWLFRRQLAAFEKRYGYDTTYAREMLDTDWRALLALGLVQPMSNYRGGVPPAARYAAKLAATSVEDCGPCTQLMVSLAEEEGVDPAVLRAIAAGDLVAMGPEAALAYRFAHAVLGHDAAADALREEVIGRFGRAGLIALSFQITAGRVYPTVKFALGHAQSCTRVTIGGVAASVRRAA